MSWLGDRNDPWDSNIVSVLDDVEDLEPEGVEVGLGEATYVVEEEDDDDWEDEDDEVW